MLHLIPAPLHRWLLRIAYRVRNQAGRRLKVNRAGVGLIALDEADRVLLARHSYGPPIWTIPGGGLKAGEDPEMALRREMREELACDLLALEPLPPLPETLSGAPHTAHLFVGRLSGDPQPDRREVLEVRYFALDALPAELGRIARQRIEHYRANLA